MLQEITCNVTSSPLSRSLPPLSPMKHVCDKALEPLSHSRTTPVPNVHGQTAKQSVATDFNYVWLSFPFSSATKSLSNKWSLDYPRVFHCPILAPPSSVFFCPDRVANPIFYFFLVFGTFLDQWISDT